MLWELPENLLRPDAKSPADLHELDHLKATLAAFELRHKTLMSLQTLRELLLGEAGLFPSRNKLT